MKKNLMIAAAICLTAGSMVIASSSTSLMRSPDAGNGYITVGRNVVVLPVPLEAGDQIDFFNLHGAKIMSKKVDLGYVSENLSTIPEGVYTLTIERDHNVITSMSVPVSGIETTH